MPTLTVPAGTLLASVCASMLIGGAIAWTILGLWGSATLWHGFWPATLISALAALLSVVPLLVGGRFGMMGAVGGYFAASAVRVVVSIGGCMALVHWWHAPLQSTLLIMCVYYAAVLSGETLLMARRLWTASGPGATATA